MAALRRYRERSAADSERTLRSENDRVLKRARKWSDRLNARGTLWTIVSQRTAETVIDNYRLRYREYTDVGEDMDVGHRTLSLIRTCPRCASEIATPIDDQIQYMDGGWSSASRDPLVTLGLALEREVRHPAAVGSCGSR